MVRAKTIERINGFRIVKMGAISDFIPETYSVFKGDDLLKIFLTKKEAVEYIMGL